MLLDSAGGAFASLIVATNLISFASARAPAKQGRARVSLECLGAAGWSVTDGNTIILIDPYLSRIIGPPPPGQSFARAPGDDRPAYGSPLDNKHPFSSATAPAGLKAPLTLRQIHPEGGTLAYLVRLRSHQILAFGGMNYFGREIKGLRPDVVLAGAGASRKEVYQYSSRLMRALGFPKIVIPTHWDYFLLPYGASQKGSIEAVQTFVREIKAASPAATVIVPKYFEPITLPAPRN